MKPQEQIKALAELDGWKFNPSIDRNGIAMPEYWTHDEHPLTYESWPVNYLNSYDAIIPLIQKHNAEEFLDTCWNMFGINGKSPSILHCTPSQLAEALLRATGKWKE